MGLTGLLLKISLQKCPFCSKEYGNHSKKGYMKCLAASSVSLHKAIQENDQLKSFIDAKMKEAEAVAKAAEKNEG